MGQAVAGTCYVKVDGGMLTVGGKVTVSPNAVNREGVSGLSGPVGYKEMPRIPSITVEVILEAGQSLAAFEALTDVTVTAELITGVTYVLERAWTSGEPDHELAEGTAELKFEGRSCTEV